MRIKPPAPCLAAIWRTPIGSLKGTIGDDGLINLKFPPPSAQTLEGNQPDGVALIKLKWLDRDREGDRALRICLESVTEALQCFFQGRPIDAPPRLDWSAASEFNRKVWEATRRIPQGQTRTYGQVAEAIGHPGAARAVGGALGRNPLILLVPCHRVVSAAAGSRGLGGFGGGIALKRYLLDFEAGYRSKSAES